MNKKITKTFIFEGLGFPIVLINAPWKKILGEWVLDINFKKLQHFVLKSLIHKLIPLSGSELRFIRKFLEMTTTDFGKLFGVSHAAVIKWENDKSQVNLGTEVCIRLYVLDHLCTRDNEFRKFYHQMSIENLIKHKKKDKVIPLEINVQEQLLAAG